MEQSERPNKVLIGIIVAAVLVLVAGYVFYLTREDNAANQAEISTSQQKPATTTSASTYTDGTYSANGVYESPGGQEEIKLTVTLENGVITNTQADAKAASGTSKQYQNEFINNYKAKVVGKNINDVTLDRVAGSSLTSDGFNDALDEIKQRAAV